MSINNFSFSSNVNNYKSHSNLVSVIVPTYNRPEGLKKALLSILNQSYSDFEILVINDAGEDVSGIINELNKEGKIKLFNHDVNKGNAGARNTGLDNAKGKYIAYLDDDDIYYEEHLKTLVSALEHSNYKVVYSDAHRALLKKTETGYELQGKDVPYSDDFNRDKLFVNNYIPNLCVMHHRNALEKGCRFDENLKSHVDWDFLLQLSMHFDFTHINKITCEFTTRNDASNLTHDRALMLDTLNIIYDKTSDFVAGNMEISQGRNYFRAWLEQEVEKLKQIKNTMPEENNKMPENIAKDFAKLKSQVFEDLGKEYDVNIVIPVFNKSALTEQCLDSILNLECKTRYKITVVNNGSSDDTLGILEDYREAYSNIDIISNASNLGFSRACNQGIKNSNEEFVLLLNNDTIPKAGWLDSLMNEIKSDENIAAVGSCLLYPDNELIQHSWVTIGNDKGHIAPYHAYKYGNRDELPETQVSRDVNAVTGACIIIRKEAAEKVKYFSEEYINGFEDIDFCLKLRESGYRIRYCADSILYHLESMTEKRHSKDMDNWLLLKKTWEHKNVFDESPDQTARSLALIEKRRVDALNYVSELNDNFKNKTKQTDIDFSIIIPVHNNLEFTGKCLEGIEKTKGITKIEIIIIDNASSDGTSEYLNELKTNIKIIRNESNENYSHTNNQGAAIAGGKYLLFLNNDTYPFPGWLDALKKEFDENPNTAVQGAKLLYQNGLIQHAGMVFGKRAGFQESPYHAYLTADPMQPFVNKRRKVQFVTGACLAIRKDLFIETGGFDEEYIFGWEDTDLCMKINEDDRDIIYNPECVLYHFESVTKKLKQSEGSDMMDPNSLREIKNRERFFSKWSKLIKKDAETFYAEDGFKIVNNNLVKISELTYDNISGIKNIKKRDTGTRKELCSFSSDFSNRDYFNASSVLIKCAAAIGDSLTVTAIVRNIKKQYPHLKIIISGVEFVKDIFLGHPDAASIVAAGSEEELMFENMCDIVIDYNNIIAFIPDYYNRISYMDIIANMAGIKFEERSIIYKILEEEKSFAEKEMSAFKKDNFLIGVQFVTSKDPHRSYPYGINVINQIIRQSTNIKFLILGLDDKISSKENIYNCGTKAPGLRDQIALASHCDAFLTIDSAFFHIGHNLFNKPTMVISGITNPKLIGNPGAGFSYIRNEDSAFLNTYWQKAGINDSMSGLQPELVSDSFIKMLDRY